MTTKSYQPRANNDVDDVLSHAATPTKHAEDQVAVTFDWQPVVTDGRARFHLTLQRKDRRSNVTFEINLNKLTESELERLHHFLVRRHLNATTHEEMADSLCWLIDCSLRQTEAALTRPERDARLRHLLLCREAV